MSLIAVKKNGYGNINIVYGVPSGLAHVTGLRLGPLCRKLGIEFAPALTGWVGPKIRRRPKINGVIVLAAEVDSLCAAIVAREARAKTPQQKAKARNRRQLRDIAAFKQRILDQFPSMPKEDAESCASHACEIGSGRVGRSSTCDDPVIAAVIAYIRHNCTAYDSLLANHYDRDDARERVAGKIQGVCDRWQAPKAHSAILNTHESA